MANKNGVGINYQNLKNLKEQKKSVEDAIRREEYKCIHIAGGKVAITDPDHYGFCTCKVCGQRFRPDNMNIEDINLQISNVKNIIQTLAMLEGCIVTATNTENMDLNMNEVSDVLVFLDKLESLFMTVDKKYNDICNNGIK